MRPLSTPDAFYLFRIVFVAFIAWASATTFLAGAGATASHSQSLGLAVRVLASVEILAAVAFLWLPFQKWAGALLLLVFVVAAIGDMATGGFPARFAYFAATTLVLMTLEPRLRTLA